ncbi:unnamed protein product [Caenorhabditis auriculariae]|uniref:K Homology domain-containing protein n=1 Tax=Caenorhabditis auriculariae TaxID=2777116 RepID=A0A8S1GTE3_9PELO|nr:unnamed protein product [Caenorhabditis auriculariae]
MLWCGFLGLELFPRLPTSFRADLEKLGVEMMTVKYNGTLSQPSSAWDSMPLAGASSSSSTSSGAVAAAGASSSSQKCPSQASPVFDASDFHHEMTSAEHVAAAHALLANGSNGVPHHPQQQYSVEYLSQLLKDKKQLAAFPNVFHHLERLADEEISKVRVALFQFEFTKDQVALPDAEGEVQVTTEKVFVPAKEHPDVRFFTIFVGRILGPRGMTAKQLEQETGCKIMVRGRGSMRDKKKEEMNRGKPNWEHLSEELHVLIQCEDTPNRARVKLARAVDEVRKLLVPAPEGEDELKRKQLMELAIINGTYRSGADQSALAAAQIAAVKQQPLAAAIQAAMNAQAQAQARSVLPMLARSPTLAVAGAPIVMSPSSRATNAAATTQAALFMQQQSQLQNAQSGNAVAVAAAQQAALLQQQQQQQQQAAEYQQLLLSQGLYDLNAAAAMQQYAVAAAAQNNVATSQYGVLASQYADYAGVDLTAQAATGPMLNSRRMLGATRDHPYKQ